jgi:hypothetical protein
LSFPTFGDNLTPEEVISEFVRGPAASANPDETMHQLRQDLKVRDALWVALDTDKIKVTVFNPWVDSLGEAIMAFPDDSIPERVDWLRDHGWGEIHFFAAWTLWRDSAPKELLERCLAKTAEYLGAEPRLTWLMALTEYGGKSGSNLPCRHELPALELGEDGLVHAFDDFEGAFLANEDLDALNDAWTRG